jgi:cell division protein FtsQ
VETPRPKAESQSTKRTKARAPFVFDRISATKLAAYVVLFLLCSGGALYAFNVMEQFLISDPRFALNGPEGGEDAPTLAITGGSHVSQRAIRAVFNDDLGMSVYLIPIRDRSARLRSIDWVKDASIARFWPNRLIVHVRERVPVAFISLGPQKFSLIDEDGVLLPPVHDRFRLPVITGVRASQPVAERRDRVRRMVRVTDELGEASQRLAEIDVSDKDNLKVTEPYDGRMLTLLLGDHNFAVRYDNFVRHYQDIRKRLPDASTLDLRLEDRITAVE